MMTVLDQVGEIRRCVNDAGYRSKFEPTTGQWTDFEGWVSLCVALDTLEESSQALACFELQGPTAYLSLRYLHLYGMLQAAMLQQWAVARLFHALVGNELPNKPDSGWNRLRDAYAMAVTDLMSEKDAGSPQPRVSQIVVTEDRFGIIAWDKGGESLPQHIDLAALLHEYKDEVAAHLNAVLKELGSARAAR
jgi:hypothetical protein